MPGRETVTAGAAERSGLRWLWLSLLVVVLDLGSKWLASSGLDYGVPVPLLPFFDLTLLHNRGAAFSLLADQPGWQRWFFALVALGVSVLLLVWLKRTPATNRLSCISLTLILGGALGNLWDRLVHGYVVDFISLHYGPYYWPAFNIADSAICVGAVLLVWESWRRPHA